MVRTSLSGAPSNDPPAGGSLSRVGRRVGQDPLPLPEVARELPRQAGCRALRRGVWGCIL